MKKVLTLCAALLLPALASAQDASDAQVARGPLAIYSWGFGAGAVYALNDELQAKSQQFLKLNFTNLAEIGPNVALFADLDWLIPGNASFGGDIGFDFLPAKSGFRPLLGAGVGFHLMDKGTEMGKELGASITAHAGFLMDISETMALRVRLPYHMVANDTRDQAVGLDLAVVFSSPLKNIRRLKY